MSWLSGGLNQFSSLTGQITSFTKEVLTETTEEVADPVAELEVLRQKYADLKKSHHSLETELVKLREHSDEQKERTETAEFQIATISQEYRKLIESKDAEIRHLKGNNERLRQEAKSFTYNEANSPLKELAEFQIGNSMGQPLVDAKNYDSVDIGGSGEWVEHYHEDFSDVISSQAEINRLRAELTQVRLELQHYRAEKKVERSLLSEKKQNVGSMETEHTLGDQHHIFLQEKEKLKQDIKEMQAKIVDHQNSMALIQQEYEQAKEESKGLHEQIHLLSTQLCKKDKEIISLKELHFLEEQSQHIREGGSNFEEQEGNVSASVRPNREHKAVQVQESDLEAALSGEAESPAATTDCAALESRLWSMEEELKNKSESLLAVQQEYVKCSKQLAYLKDQLMEIQEQHSKKSLLADEREASLKSQLAGLQHTIEMSRTAHQEQSHQQCLQLETQLRRVKEERDTALLKMANAQEQVAMQENSIRNLQSVLEQFHSDENSRLSEASRKEVSEAHTRCQQLEEEKKSLQEQLEEAHAAAEVSSILNQELEEKEEEIRQLNKKSAKLQMSLKASQSRQDDQVDRNLVKNLVIGYVCASQQKKNEVLHLIAKILNFSSEEVESVVGRGSRASSWLAGLWQDTPTRQLEVPSSLSQLFVKFLESESSATDGPLAASSRDPTSAALTRHTNSPTDPTCAALTRHPIPPTDPTSAALTRHTNSPPDPTSAALTRHPIPPPDPTSAALTRHSNSPVPPPDPISAAATPRPPTSTAL